MWQRFQTVFLILVAVCMVGSIFFPIWMYSSADGVNRVLFPLYYRIANANDLQENYYPFCLTAILAVASATMALIAVGKYHNRVLQMKIGAFNSLLMAATVFCGIYFSNRLSGQFESGWQYGLGLYVPMGGVFFNFIANRLIRRDERLVRNADRLR